MDKMSTTHTNSLNLRRKISSKKYKEIVIAKIFKKIKIKANHHLVFIKPPLTI